MMATLWRVTVRGSLSERLTVFGPALGTGFFLHMFDRVSLGLLMASAGVLP